MERDVARVLNTITDEFSSFCHFNAFRRVDGDDGVLSPVHLNCSLKVPNRLENTKSYYRTAALQAAMRVRRDGVSPLNRTLKRPHASSRLGFPGLPTQAAVMDDASCQRTLDMLALRCSTDPRVPPRHTRLLRELKASFADHNPYEWRPPASPTLDAIHLLFFDGGSRGNPGPGGSGACIVRVELPVGAVTVLWSAAMSHAHRSTNNNQAEYRGLITGLRAARLHQWTALEVVGDSALILRQLREHAPPKNQRLLPLYAEARRLADQLGVRRWTHHVRAHNKIADSLANLALDTATSSQVHHPSDRCGHADIRAHLSNDIRPWMAASIGRVADFSLSS